jgi:hypothetical protein
MKIDGVAPCEKCERDRKHHRVSGRTAYACDFCGHHIYPLAGTLAHHEYGSIARIRRDCLTVKGKIW